MGELRQAPDDVQQGSDVMGLHDGLVADALRDNVCKEEWGHAAASKEVVGPTRAAALRTPLSRLYLERGELRQGQNIVGDADDLATLRVRAGAVLHEDDASEARQAPEVGRISLGRPVPEVSGVDAWKAFGEGPAMGA